MRMGVTLCIHMHYLHMYALSAVPNMHLAYNVLSAYILVTVDPYKFFPNSFQFPRDFFQIFFKFSPLYFIRK